MIELYWQHIGYPTSLITGWLSDALPYPLSSLILPISIVLTLNLIIIGCRNLNYIQQSPILRIWTRILSPQKRSTLYISLIGLCLLFIQAFSQGITPFDFVPTKFRIAPQLKLQKFTQQFESDTELQSGYDSLSFESEYQNSEDVWRSYWHAKGPHFYQVMEPDSMLKDLNSIADYAIQTLNYPPGRKVHTIKDMTGIPKLFGIAFGGPAYHDVITGEVVITSPQDFPISKIWRVKAILHEIIHAKGFTDEMMTEQLTWLSLNLSPQPLHQALSHYMFLAKTPGRINHPKWLLNAMIQKTLQRHHSLLNQPLVYWNKELFHALNIQVSSGQYGFVRDKKLILNKHPWFDFVYQAKQHFKGPHRERQ